MSDHVRRQRPRRNASRTKPRPAAGPVVLQALETRRLLAAPSVGSLSASPATIFVGAELTLTATNVEDLDQDVEGVSFYRESNHVSGLQLDGDEFITSTPGSGGTYSASFATPNLAVGSHVFYAHATDQEGNSSNVVSGVVTAVANAAPTVGPLTINPEPYYPPGNPITFSVASAADPNGNLAAVDYFYVPSLIDPSNLVPVGSGTSAANGYALTLAALPKGQAGTFTYAARARDTAGATSPLVFFKLHVLPFAPPTLGGLTATPSTVLAGTQVRLEVTGGTNANQILATSFYRESNGVPGLQRGPSGGDTFVASSDADPQFAVTAPTDGLASGTYTFYAVGDYIGTGTNPEGLTTNVVSTTVTVTPNQAPTIGSLVPSAATVSRGVWTTLAARGIADADGNLIAIEFFRESNGVAGLQTGTGGDTSIQFSNFPGDQAFASFDSYALVAGTYTYYARALDAAGAWSEVVSCQQKVVNIPQDRYEPNDTFAAAKDLGTLGSHFVDGLTLHDRGGADYFRFTAGSGQTLQLDLAFQSGEGNVRLELYGANQTLIATATGTGVRRTLEVPVTPGQTYYLKVSGETGTAVSSGYSLSILVNTPPAIQSLSVDPNTVVLGATVTLTAEGVTDPEANVYRVWFYRETNGILGLQTGSNADALVELDSGAAGGWSVPLSTVGMNVGVNTFYARAEDATGAFSNVATTTVTLLPNHAPTVGPLAATPRFAAAGPGILLTVPTADDVDGNLAGVRFYRESNGIPGFQPTSGGPSAPADHYFAYDDSAADGWVAAAAWKDLAPGHHRFYAVAVDVNGVTSAAQTAVGLRPLDGDANLNGTVDFADLLALARSYGKPGQSWDHGDFDGDETVAFADLLALARNYGKSAPAAPPMPAPAAATAPASTAKVTAGMAPSAAAAAVRSPFSVTPVSKVVARRITPSVLR